MGIIRRLLSLIEMAASYAALQETVQYKKDRSAGDSAMREVGLNFRGQTEFSAAQTLREGSVYRHYDTRREAIPRRFVLNVEDSHFLPSLVDSAVC